jgi:hypothetical protein
MLGYSTHRFDRAYTLRVVRTYVPMEKLFATLYQTSDSSSHDANVPVRVGLDAAPRESGAKRAIPPKSGRIPLSWDLACDGREVHLRKRQ